MYLLDSCSSKYLPARFWFIVSPVILIAVSISITSIYCAQQSDCILSMSDPGTSDSASGDPQPRGTMSPYAFFIQEKAEDYRRDHPKEDLDFSMFSKQCVETWQKMKEDEKSKYFQMAKEPQRPLESNISIQSPKVADRPVQRDPNLPEQAHHAYFFFISEHRDKVKADLSDNAIFEDVAKELSHRWWVLESPEKAKYEELAMKDKIRYEKEMAIYLQGKAGKSKLDDKEM